MRAFLLAAVLMAAPALAQAAPVDKSAPVDKPASADKTAADKVARQGALAANAEIASLSDKRDKLGGLSAEDQRRLQQAMDRKSRFEAMISNALKADEQAAHGVAGSPKDP